MSFNEVPGNDDSSWGLARRLEFVDFIKKFVDNPDPSNNELQVVDGLSLKFGTKPYGDALLARLINMYNENGFNIAVPTTDNKTLEQFMVETFIYTDSDDDVVF